MSFKTLNIGATALLTQKYALDITGHNIANASNDSYARQRVTTEAVTPSQRTFGALGNGVQIASIRRIADEFLEKQVRIAQGTHDGLDVLQDGYENLQVYFNELTDNDVSSAINTFFDAVSDFANNVEDVSTRRAMIESAKSLNGKLQDMEKKIFDYRRRLNDQVVETVGEANSLIRQIAQLNEDILHMESGGVTGVVANDLRDQRTERLKDLASLMDIKVTEESNGAVIVTQRSRLLVFEQEYFELDTRTIQSEDLLIDQVVFEEDEEEVELGDGKLWARVELRDGVLKSFKDDLDECAAGLIWEFNRVHSQNIGLEGFSDLTGTTAVIDPAVALDELTYSFTPKGDTFEIQNGNFELVVHDTMSDEEIIRNVEVDLDDNTADPDTILYDASNPTAANALVNKIQNALDTVQPGAFTVGLDLANRLQIQSNSEEFTLSFGRDTSGALAALGLNTFFSGYDAGSITMNGVAEDNPDFVAGAKSFTPGDNTGALALLELRDTGVFDNDTATIEDFYEGIVGRLGVEGDRVNSLMETQEDVLTRMKNQREDLSGVNLDEELTKMIQYQRSFQSAARFISTANVIYETLINM